MPKKRQPKPYTHRYSGRLSRGFWARVNALPFEGQGGMLYHAGVLLQNMENSILRWLYAAEKAERSKHRAR